MLLGILLGRLAGFAREMFLAARYGAGAEADIAILMLTLPDLLVNILVGGAMSVALIPAFKRYGEGPRAYCLFVQSSVLLALVFAVLTLLLSLLTMPLLRMVAPGFDAVQLQQALPLLQVVLWLIPLTVVAGVTSAFLHANDRFALSAFGTFSFNSVVLLGLGYSIATGAELLNLAFFILAAGLVRWLLLLTALPRPQLSWRCRRWRLLDRGLLLRYLHAMTAGGLLLVMPVMARAIASLHGEGGLSLFNYAMKLVEFPLSIGVMVLSVGLFPLLSQCFARREETCDEMVATGLQVVLLITVAMVLPLAWFADDFATLTFGRGAMQPDQVTLVGVLMSIGVLSLPLQGLTTMLAASYNAARDTAFVLKLNALTLLLFGLGGYWSVTRYGLEAMMWTLVVAYVTPVLLYARALHKRLGLRIGRLVWKKRTPQAVSLMLLAGGGILHLIGGLGLGVLQNALMALLVGLTMLIIGAVVSGDLRTMRVLLMKRRPQ